MVTKATDQFPDLFISRATLYVFSSVPNIFGLELVEQIFTDLTSAKLTFDFGATPTMSENEDFLTKTQYYYGNIKI